MLHLTEDTLVRTVTEDGSVTWYCPIRKATYRSTHGASDESAAVFVRNSGMLEATETWRVAELGFGVGTNFLTTARRALQQGLQLHYVTTDHAPIPPQIIEEEGPLGEMMRIALSDAREGRLGRAFHHDITLELYPTPWRALPRREAVDSVYYDPFGPASDPDSWSAEDLQFAAKLLSPTGRLTTYCAAGFVRRHLLAAGLFVATVKGPGRKREVTVASPTTQGLTGLEILKLRTP